MCRIECNKMIVNKSTYGQIENQQVSSNIVSSKLNAQLTDRLTSYNNT